MPVKFKNVKTHPCKLQTILGFSTLFFLTLFAACPAFADSTTWLAIPVTGDWNTADNWAAGGPPNGLADVATFDVSATTAVSLSANTTADGIVFNAGASAYTITATPTFSLTLGGAGVTNNSGAVQNLVTAGVNGVQGRILFTNNATAGDNTCFTNFGSTEFYNTSTAGSAAFINNGGASSGANGGNIQFFAGSSAGNGTFTNNGGAASGARGGNIKFSVGSTAGNGVFTTNGGMASGASGGATHFYLGSSTGNGTFTTNGGTVGDAYGGVIDFSGATVGSNASFTTNGGTANGAFGGTTQFYSNSSAGSGNFTTNGGTVSGAYGGTTQFSEGSTAGNGTFTTNGGTANGAFGGTTSIGGSAGNGTFTTNGGTVSGALGGTTNISGAAGNGIFTTNGGMVSGAFGGTTSIFGSAGGGTFTTNGATVSGASGGTTQFHYFSNAGGGTFTTNGGTVSGASGGTTCFYDTSSGDTPATFGVFGHAAISGTFTTNGGAVSGALGGTTQFNDRSTAGSSTFVANGGTGGGQGGQIVFSGDSTGGTATVQVFGNSALDISSHNPGSVSIGSLEGTGNAFLGANNLTVGGNNLSTIFSGVIQDSGGINFGSFTKAGTGTLTLSGANTYTGGTTINEGTLVAANNNALGTGSVTINAGTLLIQTGTTISNSIVLHGGNLAQTFSAGTSLADAINTTSDPSGTQTVAEILDGTTSSVATLQSSFAGFSLASNDVVRLSDVFSLSGVPVIDGLTGETDTFVLQLQIVDVNADSFLGWLDPATNQWVNAVDGNIGGTAFFAGDQAYNPLTDFVLGTYGVDTANNTVWAVINHNSEFAAIPEPAPCALLALGGAAVFFGLRFRRVG